MNKILTAGLFALELGISALADSKDEPAYNSETLPPPRYIPSGWTEEVAKNMFGHQIMLINQRSMSRPIFYFETLARDYSVWFKLDENNSVMFTDSRDEKELDEIAFFYRGERNAKISLTGEIKEKLEQILGSTVYEEGVSIGEIDGKIMTIPKENYSPQKEEMDGLGAELSKFLGQYKKK